MKHYTIQKAVKEIGKSIAWRDARRVAIKKWQEIVKNGVNFYRIGQGCGFCFVIRNRRRKGLNSFRKDCRKSCPAHKICDDITITTPEGILKRLRKLKR